MKGTDPMGSHGCPSTDLTVPRAPRPVRYLIDGRGPSSTVIAAPLWWALYQLVIVPWHTPLQRIGLFGRCRLVARWLSRRLFFAAFESTPWRG